MLDPYFKVILIAVVSALTIGGIRFGWRAIYVPDSKEADAMANTELVGWVLLWLSSVAWAANLLDLLRG